MVTKGEKYTDYEKLLLPFDVTTWILLIGTFCLAFSLIFIINHANRKIQKIVFGDGVSMPTYNVVSTFFGVSLSKLPSSNFARFILINFICFCLIFRTAYQGALFDYMNSDMRKPHALTFDEVFDNNYTILGYDIHIGWQFFESFDERRQKQIDMKTLTPGDFYQVCEYIKDDVTKTAIVTEEYFDLKVRGTCNLYDVVEETMQWMLQAGIVQYWYAYFHWYNYQRFHIETSQPNKILSMSDLSYGFNIWLIVCGIAIVEFLFELIIGKITRKKKCQKANDIEKIKIQSPEAAIKNDLNEEESEFSEIIFETTEIKIETQLLESDENLEEEKSKKMIFGSTIDNLSNDSLLSTATIEIKEFKQSEVANKPQSKNEQKEKEKVNKSSNEQQTNDKQSNISKEINQNSVELQTNQTKSFKKKKINELKHPIENDLKIIDLINDETEM
ncbi:hypothetical protein PVAND_017259 [Polypedilum vanderplanki]|uniref:Ionotropic glutamate receptor C-terminal domain-containing protein n=1 Tax=Polypedilum vanderplanki TaxID=319348 RepID=A0A9J6BHR0_POLVA|nr:hypothetical protein PVAND_017259 [Polypedilum vanderplanki]